MPTPLTNKVSHSFSWTLPPTHHYKLNIDGAFDTSTNHGGAGGLFRDHMGSCITVFIKHILHTDVLQAELFALFNALQIAINRHLWPLIIKTDSQELIRLIVTDNPKHSHLLYACRLMLHYLQVQHIDHVYREGNGVTDALAKWGKPMTQLNPQDVQIFDPPPHPTPPHSFRLRTFSF